MKTRLMTLVVMMAVSMGSFGLMAQNTPDVPAQKRAKQRPTPEQMMDRHVKMMEKKLVMDDATAAKFTPLYKEYLQAMKDCRPAVNKELKKAEMTDAEIEKAIQDRFDARQKALDVQQDRKLLTYRKSISRSSRKCLMPSSWRRFSSSHVWAAR